MKPILSTHNLGKSYQKNSEIFWALKNITFQVYEGQIIGILGNNGSGKSTLLKLIAKITRPTTGEIDLNAKVGALLEIGTGFHPDLTGMENIFLSGAILGMKKHSIKKKLDQIISFSEIEDFLHLPTKKYSSGMLLKLGFSVLCHLDSQLIIIDETLSVGDIDFRKKCLQKIKNLAVLGKTTLIVTHEKKIIDSLCNRIISLDKGMLKKTEINN